MTMGTTTSSLFARRLFGPKVVKIVIFGFDATGKTTILYRFKLGKTVFIMPTIGYNVEMIKYKNIEFTMWDACAQNHAVDLWHHYYENVKGVIFVIDSTDRERFHNVCYILQRTFEDEKLHELPFLIFANKQDIPNAMTTDEIMDKLGKIRIDRIDYHLQPACAITGEGLYEGLDWLADKLTNR